MFIHIRGKGSFKQIKEHRRGARSAGIREVEKKNALIGYSRHKTERGHCEGRKGSKRDYIKG